MVNVWIEALKDYNANKNTWCIPRKNSRDYNAIMSALKGVASLTPSPPPLPKPSFVRPPSPSSSSLPPRQSFIRPQTPSLPPRQSFIRPQTPSLPLYPREERPVSRRMRIVKKYDGFGRLIQQE